MTGRGLMVDDAPQSSRINVLEANLSVRLAAQVPIISILLGTRRRNWQFGEEPPSIDSGNQEHHTRDWRSLTKHPLRRRSCSWSRTGLLPWPYPLACQAHPAFQSSA